MKVKVKFFAILREKIGDELILDVENVEDLLLKIESIIRSKNIDVSYVISLNGKLMENLGNLKNSENIEGSLTDKSTIKLKDGDVIDVLPPFSGG